MSNTYQMNYRTPIAESWNHNIPLPTPEAADDVSSMLERLKAESNSLESYFTELENELKRVHLKRKIVGKKLGVLSELVKDVDALHAEPAVAVRTVAAGTEMQAAPRHSRKKQTFAVASIILVALAIAFIALEKTGQISCVTCAPARLLGLK
ncbi:hypothetical protein B0G75_10866 [Paraburkholderia sp. BL18I3N2]|uniref:hypothetical protein n=1 Tax=Paraburkholderia sp. BL18I3N2 TaxID=1938799 RepID=UPI000D498080|nr:hypothetical protein [Paraburkholderia sp. BL18I3N2]PRX29576.1 hypothetical protein B0G75_10866 [Paraburkholderia sp. BL18I3N2]